MTKYKILVVDDEESLCEILQFNLEVEGYEVDVAYSAEQALDMHPERYSLILLDVMMGEMSGFKMARQLRAQPETAAVPIIFCTAKDTEDDTVAGLNIGADDYIAKPFSVREVLARVRSVLRRTAPQEGQSRAIAFEGLHMDLVRKICTVDGTPLALTKKEFEILALLLVAELLGGGAHGLDDDGNGALFTVIVVDGDGDALAVFIHPQDDELAGLCLPGNHRSLDLIQDHGGFQRFFGHDAIHGRSFFPNS